MAEKTNDDIRAQTSVLEMPPSTLTGKFGKAFREPSVLFCHLKKRLIQAWRVYICRDEFTIALTKWFRDKGDDTLRLNYSLNPDSIVFDLGGYRGDFAEAIYKKHGCYVFVFEPVTKFYLESVSRFEHNERVKCFNYGLSDSSGSFSISNKCDGSSLVRNNADSECEVVFVNQFSAEIEKLQIKQIDLLKVNVEGSEFLLLPHILDSNLISIIKNIQVQFHAFYPNARILRDEIRSRISETHKEMWNYPFVWESWTLKSTPTQSHAE